MVPAQNLYRLLCYAWDYVEGLDLVDAGASPFETVEDLLSNVLLTGTRQLLRRGLDRAYVRYEDDLAAPRGKLHVSTTIKRALERSGRAACSFDELDPDVLHNRILRTTLLRLARTKSVERGQRQQLRQTADRMAGVGEIDLNEAVFRRVQLHRNNAHYRFLLQLCELVWAHLVPVSQGSGYRFVDFRASPQVMGSVFEAFVRVFLRREQSFFTVGGERVGWALEPASPGAAQFLPAMRTDICLVSKTRKVVIDAKLYKHAFASGIGGKRTLHSGHVYQLLAYLGNLELNGHQRPADVGVLLYGTTNDRFDLRYAVMGKEVRVCALDLAQPWTQLRADLLEISRGLQPDIALHPMGDGVLDHHVVALD